MSEEVDLSIAAARQRYFSRYDINNNLIESSKYLFMAHSLPYLTFFAQTISLPSVSSQDIMQDTPYSTTYRAGDKIMYDPLVVSFLIDEDLKVWEELHNWIRGYTFPVDRNEYKKQKQKGIYFDMTCLFLKNSFESNLAFKFYNAFPTSVGPVSMASTDLGGTTLTTDVTLRYDYFDIKRGSF